LPRRSRVTATSTAERTESPHEGDRAADHLQHLHDFRLVGTSEVSRGAALQGDCGELADRLLRILLPANRIGSYEFTAAQLKTIQEVITLTVFAAFSVLYLKQPLRWNYLAGFALIVVAVAVIFRRW
jgi:hypothetical protein